MHGHLSIGARPGELTVRCECGATIRADHAARLVELARLHYGEFHPDLGGWVPADLIMAMAERVGPPGSERLDLASGELG